MGLILLDTSILIDHLRGNPAAGEALDEAASEGHGLVVSTLTVVELMAGMRSHERTATGSLMDALTTVDVDDEISQRAGELARRFRSSHQGVGVVDYVIGATAQHLDAALWTRNLRHFPMFPDLKAPY
jgi:predicted nucleic acid-binding protein